MNEEREIFKGDIYWSNQPFMKSHLQKGSRPYLVVSSRNNKGYVSVMPVTSKIKELPNRYDIVVKGKHNQVIVDQPQTVPIPTLGRYLDRIDDADVDSCLQVMLEFFGCDFADEDEDIEFWQRMYFDSADLDD